MRIDRPLGVLAASLASSVWLASSAADTSLAIDHRPIDCVVAGKFPELESRLDPADEVARARVYFRGEGGLRWYFVEMKRQSGSYRGVLPKPKKDLARIRYYIEATGKDFTPVRTEEFAPDVVPDAAACKGKAVAAGAGTASVVIGAESGAPAVPLGFSGSGVTVAGTPIGPAAGGGGGGLGTTAAVVGGIGAAAAAAVALSSGGGGNEGCSRPGDVVGSLVVQERSATTLTLQWSTQPPSPEGCYVVNYVPGLPSCSTAPGVGERAIVVQGMTVVLTGLTPSAVYQIHVHPLAVCPGGSIQGRTNSVFVRTLAAGAGPQPAAPSDYESCC